MNTVELPIRTVLDDEDRRRIRSVANALTKASGAVAELAEAFALLADGGRVLDDKPVVGSLVRIIPGEHGHGVTQEFVGKLARVVRIVKKGPAEKEHLVIEVDGETRYPLLHRWHIDYADVVVAARRTDNHTKADLEDLTLHYRAEAARYGKAADALENAMPLRDGLVQADDKPSVGGYRVGDKVWRTWLNETREEAVVTDLDLDDPAFPVRVHLVDDDTERWCRLKHLEHRT